MRGAAMPSRQGGITLLRPGSRAWPPLPSAATSQTALTGPGHAEGSAPNKAAITLDPTLYRKVTVGEKVVKLANSDNARRWNFIYHKCVLY